jgi:non-ribosomal peptide synthetase component F
MLFHHPFEQNVERVPEKIALICGEQRLAYAELEVRANRVTGNLKGRRRFHQPQPAHEV